MQATRLRWWVSGAKFCAPLGTTESDVGPAFSSCATLGTTGSEVGHGVNDAAWGRGSLDQSPNAAGTLGASWRRYALESHRQSEPKATVALHHYAQWHPVALCAGPLSGPDNAPHHTHRSTKHANSYGSEQHAIRLIAVAYRLLASPDERGISVFRE